MIPSSTTKAFLYWLLSDLQQLYLQTQIGMRMSGGVIDGYYRSFCDVLNHAEYDLSMILILLENDYDCQKNNPEVRLKALCDYVEIACALHNFNEMSLLGAKSN